LTVECAALTTRGRVAPFEVAGTLAVITGGGSVVVVTAVVFEGTDGNAGCANCDNPERSLTEMFCGNDSCLLRCAANSAAKRLCRKRAR